MAKKTNPFNDYNRRFKSRSVILKPLQAAGVASYANDEFRAIGVEVSQIQEEVMMPEKRLWYYVLLHGMKGSVTGSMEDLTWTFCDNNNVGSFNWICDMLDLETAAVRRDLVRNLDHLKNRQLARYANWPEKEGYLAQRYTNGMKYAVRKRN